MDCFRKWVAWLSNFPPITYHPFIKMVCGKNFGIFVSSHSHGRIYALITTRLKIHSWLLSRVILCVRKYDLIGCEKSYLFLARSTFLFLSKNSIYQELEMEKRGWVILWDNTTFWSREICFCLSYPMDITNNKKWSDIMSLLN